MRASYDFDLAGIGRRALVFFKSPDRFIREPPTSVLEIPGVVIARKSLGQARIPSCQTD
jgi:hypothetical protein